MKKILDFAASLCLLFDVDWDTDFEDDEYVLERRREEARKASAPRIRVLPAAPPRKAV